MTVRQLTGDCREVLRSLHAESVQACITSPPHYGLRDYGTPPLVADRESRTYVQDRLAQLRARHGREIEDLPLPAWLDHAPEQPDEVFVVPFQRRIRSVGDRG